MINIVYKFSGFTCFGEELRNTSYEGVKKGKKISSGDDEQVSCD